MTRYIAAKMAAAPIAKSHVGRSPPNRIAKNVAHRGSEHMITAALLASMWDWAQVCTNKATAPHKIARYAIQAQSVAVAGNWIPSGIANRTNTRVIDNDCANVSPVASAGVDQRPSTAMCMAYTIAHPTVRSSPYPIRPPWGWMVSAARPMVASPTATQTQRLTRALNRRKPRIGVNTTYSPVTNPDIDAEVWANPVVCNSCAAAQRIPRIVPWRKVRRLIRKERKKTRDNTTAVMKNRTARKSATGIRVRIDLIEKKVDPHRIARTNRDQGASLRPYRVILPEAGSPLSVSS